jgi:heat shock protein 5
MQECERAKISLSLNFSTTIRLPTFHEDRDLEVTIERTEFEELAKPILERLEEPLEEAITDAGIAKDEVTEILLVGGSSRIPWVRAWLEEYFGRPPNDMLNADEGVAYGATVMAGLVSGEDPLVDTPEVQRQRREDEERKRQEAEEQKQLIGGLGVDEEPAPV